MKAKARKQLAQENLVSAAIAAFYSIDDPNSSCYIADDQDREAVRDEMSKQLARVENLFGYEPYSFGRG